MYLPSDQRRVQAAFDAAVPAPYETTISLEDTRKTMRVVVDDPDDASKTIVQALWWYEETKPRGTAQPSDAELAQITAAFTKVVSDYEAEKAAGSGGG